jgi:hypothetical protein
MLVVGKRTETAQVGSAQRKRRASAAADVDLFDGHPVIIPAKAS